MRNSKKIVSINEVRYKKYGDIDQGNVAPVYKQLIEIDYKKNIRKQMIKGYIELLTKYYDKGGE